MSNYRQNTSDKYFHFNENENEGTSDRDMENKATLSDLQRQ